VHFPPRAVEHFVPSGAHECMYVPGMSWGNPEVDPSIMWSNPCRRAAKDPHEAPPVMMPFRRSPANLLLSCLTIGQAYCSWKSLSEYRTIAGGVSAPFDNMVRRALVAARTSASAENSPNAKPPPEPSLSNKSNRAKSGRITSRGPSCRD